MPPWWKEVWCRYCGAPPGESCVSVTGLRTYPHIDRQREAEYDEFDEPFEPRTFARPMITVYLPGDAP